MTRVGALERFRNQFRSLGKIKLVGSRDQEQVEFSAAFALKNKGFHDLRGRTAALFRSFFGGARGGSHATNFDLETGGCRSFHHAIDTASHR